MCNLAQTCTSHDSLCPSSCNLVQLCPCLSPLAQVCLSFIYLRYHAGIPISLRAFHILRREMPTTFQVGYDRDRFQQPNDEPKSQASPVCACLTLLNSCRAWTSLSHLVTACPRKPDHRLHQYYYYNERKSAQDCPNVAQGCRPCKKYALITGVTALTHAAIIHKRERCAARCKNLVVSESVKPGVLTGMPQTATDTLSDNLQN